MIRDFLDIARLESGRQQIRRLPFSLEHMVAETLESIQSSAGKKGILVTQEGPEHTSLYNFIVSVYSPSEYSCTT